MKSTASSTTPTTLIATPVLEACLESLYELSAEWHWKRGTTKANQQEMDELDILIGKIQRATDKTNARSVRSCGVRDLKQ